MADYTDSAKRLFNTHPDKTWRIPVLEFSFAGSSFSFNTKLWRTTEEATAVIDGISYDPSWFEIAAPSKVARQGNSTIKITFSLFAIKQINEIMSSINGIDFLTPILCTYKTYIATGDPVFSPNGFSEDFSEEFAGGSYVFDENTVLGFTEDPMAVTSITKKAGGGISMILSTANRFNENRVNRYVSSKEFFGIIK